MAAKGGGKPPTPRDSGKSVSSIASKAMRGKPLTLAERKSLGASVMSQNQKP